MYVESTLFMLYYMYKNKTKSCLLLFVTVLDAANPIISHGIYLIQYTNW